MLSHFLEVCLGIRYFPNLSYIFELVTSNYSCISYDHTLL